MDETRVKQLINEALAGSFTTTKLGDTPTDALQLVNRRYVNLYGSTLGRPKYSVVGQYYLDTTIGRPVYWTGTKWVDGAGSVS